MTPRNPERAAYLWSLYQTGLSCDAIGKLVGRAGNSVSQMLRNNGYEMRPAGAQKKRGPKPTPAHYLAMHAACETEDVAVVAERFQITPKAMRKAFSRYGMTANAQRRKRTPVSADDIQALLAATKPWCGQCELRVCPADVARCRSRFCGMRAVMGPPVDQQEAAHA
jgi:transposase